MPSTDNDHRFGPRAGAKREHCRDHAAHQRIVARALLIPCLILMLLIVWLPGDDAEVVTGIVAHLAHAIAQVLGIGFDPVYAVLEFTANIALFVPFGFLLITSFRRFRVWHATLCGLTLTMVIETVQIWLPSRYAMLSDVIANTAGAALGAGIAVLVARILKRDS